MDNMVNVNVTLVVADLEDLDYAIYLLKQMSTDYSVGIGATITVGSPVVVPVSDSNQ